MCGIIVCGCIVMFDSAERSPESTKRTHLLSMTNITTSLRRPCKACKHDIVLRISISDIAIRLHQAHVDAQYDVTTMHWAMVMGDHDFSWIIARPFV